MIDGLLAGGDCHSGDAETATQKTVCHLEESCGGLRDIADKLSFRSHIVEGVQHGLTRDLDMVEDKSGIVDSIESDLVAHVLNHDTLAGFHLFVPDSHDEAVNSLVLASHNGLSEDDSVVGMACTIGNPELLAKSRG